MRVKFICKYCDNKWTRNVYSNPVPKQEECTKCKDRNVRYIVLDEDRVDYYEGCLPFPTKPNLEPEEPEIPGFMYYG